LGVATVSVSGSHAPFHFDLSISDLYSSLGSGANVRLISSVEGMLAGHLVKLIPECGNCRLVFRAVHPGFHAGCR